MKKNLFLIAMIAIFSALSVQTQAQTLPQEIISFDFENGTYDGWAVWNNNTNEVVGSNAAFNSSHAVKLTSAMHFGIDLKAEKASYVVTADLNPIWGNVSTARVQMYDKAANKFFTVTEIELPTEKGYKKIEMKFKGKGAGHYRIAFIPNGQRGASFVLDNVKLTRTK